ncbi:response regulator transcription factor [Candidatus Neomarinimicrobiota bacterium]
MKGKILLVEDNEVYAKVIKVCLEESGHEVYLVGDGESALDSAKKIMPNAILLDIMLPGINGIAVCKKFKADATLHSVPIIMLTAKSEAKDVQTAINAGADDYITKNNDIETVWREIEEKIFKSLLKRVQDSIDDDSPTLIRDS